MGILVMRIPDLVEKVDTFRAREERRTDRVHVRIAPALFIHTRFPNRTKGFKPRTGGGNGGTYLIIEASVVIKVIEIGRECFSTPKFHIGDLKVVVDCLKISIQSGKRRE